MKVRSILASLGACAIAVSAMATTAFAGEVPLVNGTEADGKYCLSVQDHLPEGKKLTDVYGAEVVISGVNTQAGAGGGIILQSDSAGWNQKQWGNEGSTGTDIFYSYEDFKITRLESASPFAESDTWANVVISQWDNWGDPVKVESVKLLGKDGKELTAGATDDTPATTTTTQQAVISPNNNNNNNNNNTKTTGAKTGDAGVGVAVAGLALAGIGIVVTRKKH